MIFSLYLNFTILECRNYNLLHYNLAFSQCSTSIYQAFDGQTEFSWVFTFAILSYHEILENLMNTQICFAVFDENMDKNMVCPFLCDHT